MVFPFVKHSVFLYLQTNNFPIILPIVAIAKPKHDEFM